MMPLVSELYRSTKSEVVLVVRRRPHVVNGGGFVVTDFNMEVVFRVDGCGVIGKKEQLVLRDGNRDPLLLIRRKGGMVEALNIHKTWNGYEVEMGGCKKLVFSLKEPNSSCLVSSDTIRITTKSRISRKDWEFEINGYFPDRECSIIDSTSGSVVAQIGVNKEVEEMVMSKDLYQVVVKSGIDQAFVFGVIAILDYMYGESTSC